jgi:Tfp pilus assembly major pilin PilA
MSIRPIKNFFSNFTLIEVMIIVAICGIIAAVTVEGFDQDKMKMVMVAASPSEKIIVVNNQPETRNPGEMIAQIDIYQKQYNISELELPEKMRNPNQKDWYFPR